MVETQGVDRNCGLLCHRWSALPVGSAANRADAETERVTETDRRAAHGFAVREGLVTDLFAGWQPDRVRMVNDDFANRTDLYAKVIGNDTPLRLPHGANGVYTVRPVWSQD